MKMVYSFYFLIFLVLISGDLKLSAADESSAVRPPEHTCRKVISSGKCDRLKCTQECSKESGGVADCKDNGCICTYYCQQPPL